MNRQTPIWLSNRSVGRDEGVKKYWKASGHNQPKSDGPSRMPAIISPITAVWPNRMTRPPQMRDTTTIRITCSSSRVSGSCEFSRRFASSEAEGSVAEAAGLTDASGDFAEIDAGGGGNDRPY